MILKDILGDRAKIYNIYTDSTPRYVGGSAGLTFYKGRLVVAIRQTTNISIGGSPHYNYRFVHEHRVPYLNNSKCMLGWIDLNEFNENPIIQVITKEMNNPFICTKNIFKGPEDPRLIVWNNELYAYCTQFTDDNPYGSSILCYQLDDFFNVKDIIQLPGLSSSNNVFTEKNWMAIPDSPMDFIYMLSIESNNIKPIIYSQISNIKDFNISNYRGSTPLLKTKNGYISIIHTSDKLSYGLSYNHYLCFFDQNLNLKSISDKFHFEQFGIEFCTGWCLDDNDNLYIAYSTTDGTTNIMMTSLDDLKSVLNNENYGVVKTNPKETANKLFKTNPIDAAQYYWKDWVQNSNRNSLYSHYAILLYHLDRYLLPDSLPYLEDDESVNALILKIYHHRRTNRDFSKFYEMRDKLHNKLTIIDNKHILHYKLERMV